MATSASGPELRVIDRSAVTTDQAGSVQAVATPVARTFAVVLINFTNLATQPWTKAAVASAVTGAAPSLKTFYEEESKGRMTVGATVYGWYTIDATTTGCDWRTWHTLGWNAATAAGANLSTFTNVMFIWPQTSECGFAGVGYVPGSYTYINGTLSVQVMTHEVGHNFGLGHANARNCVVGGTRVTIAANASCTTQTYADPFSTMGNNALRHNQGSQLGELGWLDASQKVVGTPGNTYTISPYLGTGPVKLVRIPRGDGSFFDLDVRTPYGSFDTFAAGSPAVSGATIRLGWGTASPTGIAPGHRAPRHHAGDRRPEGRPAPRRQVDHRSRLDDLVRDPVDRQRRRHRPGHRGHRAGCAGIAGRDARRRAEREPRLDSRDRQRRGRLVPGDPRRLDRRDTAGHGRAPGPTTPSPRARPHAYAVAAIDTSGNVGSRRDEDRRCPRGRADPDADSGPDRRRPRRPRPRRRRRPRPRPPRRRPRPRRPTTAPTPRRPRRPTPAPRPRPSRSPARRRRRPSASRGAPRPTTPA